MKKLFTVLTAILLCAAMLLTFTSCSGTEEGESEDTFVAATIDTGDSIPVSKAEIIAFYNDIITKVQLADTFTAENKPGVRTSESLSVDNLNILSYDKATGEAAESDALKALNASAGEIKNRILGKIDTSVPVIAFGDMDASIDAVIYPYDSAEVKLTDADVADAACHADGNNLNISITLANNEATAESVFGLRNKEEVLALFNENTAEWASINDYTVNHSPADVLTEEVSGEEITKENPVYSTINLSVELEKQEDGTRVCTGRITSFSIRMVADVSATASCKGSFADYGDIQVNFRLTDEKRYEFDWLGTAEWEPVEETEAVSE